MVSRETRDVRGTVCCVRRTASGATYKSIESCDERFGTSCSDFVVFVDQVVLQLQVVLGLFEDVGDALLVQGSRFRIQGAGFRVWGSGFRV